MQNPVFFIQAPPQPRGYDVEEENEFYTKYWNIYTHNLNTHPVNNPIWEMPVWVPLLSGILEHEGIPTQFIDLSNYCGKQSYFDGVEFSVSTIEEYLAGIVEKNSICLLSPMTLNFDISLEIARVLKKIDPSITVIMGGCHVTFTDISILDDGCVDFIVHGDAEYNLPNLIQAIESKSDLQNIVGISYFDKNGIARTNKSKPLLKHPRTDYSMNYELFPKDFGQKVPYLRTSLNRGCQHRCAFCGDIWNHMKPQEYPIQFVLKDIDELRNRFGNQLFYINDENFSGLRLKSRILEFCNAVSDKNIQWVVQTRIDELDIEVLKAMYKAGCRQIELGFESITQNALTTSRKGTHASQILSALETVKNIGYSVYGYWMAGLPDEDKSSTVANRDYIVSIIKSGLLDLLNYGIMVPYPGTAVFYSPQKFGLKIHHYNYRLYQEYGIPVYDTKYLTSNEIFLLWKTGLAKFADALPAY